MSPWIVWARWRCDVCAEDHTGSSPCCPGCGAAMREPLEDAVSAYVERVS